jgi:thiamine pyrophosphokinase
VDTVVVVAGGAPLARSARHLVPPDATVVAADSGYDLAGDLGLDVDLVVGDLDSVSPDGLARLERDGTDVRRHPVDKDATDLALALDAAVAMEPRRVVVLGGGGGRLDHLLANVLLLADDDYADVTIEADLGGAHVHVVRDAVAFDTRPGVTVSLLPALGPVTGVRTSGLRFPLDDESLCPGSTRGVSNETSGDRVHVEVGSGVLLVVRPAAVDEPDRPCDRGGPDAGPADDAPPPATDTTT